MRWFVVWLERARERRRVAAMAADFESGANRGPLVAVGGAESRSREPLILGRFVYVSGGRSADLLVIPTASSRGDAGADYRRVFLRLGARSANVLAVGDRAEAMSELSVETVRRASGIFFTGGDQMTLADRISGTAVADAIRSANASGVAVGGTSAGAAFLSQQMIAYGKSGSAPRADMVTLAPGLGLTSLFVIDQHFRQRDRLGRLLTALAAQPGTIGLGLDENTAAFIGPDCLEVVGDGTITLVDTADATTPAVNRPDRHDPICLLGLRLHILTHGAVFDISSRTAKPPGHGRRE